MGLEVYFSDLEVTGQPAVRWLTAFGLSERDVEVGDHIEHLQ